ncbi:hypothetical protein HELRODRAFT_104538 [Helobdella robusta]|uniref:Tektin n=1 Tax=Helobdella robusta TaxID=6412 RepID=T1EDM3_HELRO|nr:hypothetical protein HELRODRAFT_104538 [Helobdella robusta]ESN89890.1 hypothetical protein HELRODRAFT_104538 [Helobdella robusta]
MATQLKSAPRFSTTDWFINNYNVSLGAEKERANASEVKQEARYLRNETNNRTKWDQMDNNTRLADRVDDVRRWRDILDITLSNVEKEIVDLTTSKDELERALEDKNTPTEVNVENLVLRDARRGIDLVLDEADDELNKEKRVIEESKQLLQRQVDASFEIICALQEARQKLLADIQDKNVAIDVDIEQYNLTEDSSMISFKPDPLRVPKGSVTLKEWEDHCRESRHRAEVALANAKMQREANVHAIQQTDNDLAAQLEATHFMLRKRIHEMEQALDELNWQKQQTEEEMKELEEDLKKQEAAIRATINPAKLAQTRMENRTFRPNMEKCLDSPFYGLSDEVRQIDSTKKALQEKFYQTQHAWNALEERLHNINKEIQSKTQALKLDKQCLNSRAKLKTKNAKINEGTCHLKNMDLTGLNLGKPRVMSY